MSLPHFFIEHQLADLCHITCRNTDMLARFTGIAQVATSFLVLDIPVLKAQWDGYLETSGYRFRREPRAQGIFFGRPVAEAGDRLVGYNSCLCAL